MNLRSFHIAIALSALFLSSCNKNEVIEAPAPPPLAGSDIIVYDYMPAPGQFVNEDGPMTAAQAVEWAQQRLRSADILSLGAFGGYIVVGFGRPIGDFVVKGNAFSNLGGSSNEPGVVSVMRDDNANGLPDDRWYELRGSESDAPTTIRDYAVTYYRPSAAASDVAWTDNRGASGTIDYLATYHAHSSYYPSWVDADSYTLSGTLVVIDSRTDELGRWWNDALPWGYADNVGSNDNKFHLSDAIDASGQYVPLDKIDFIRIHTAVNGKCGHLGELSTEITSIHELTY